MNVCFICVLNTFPHRSCFDVNFICVLSAFGFSVAELNFAAGGALLPVSSYRYTDTDNDVLLCHNLTLDSKELLQDFQWTHRTNNGLVYFTKLVQTFFSFLYHCVCF